MLSIAKKFEHLKIQREAIISATNNFAESNCIGRGGFGKVYKGELYFPSKGHTTVAIKRLDRAFGQGDPQFWKEIVMLSLYKHENIVSLLGFCDNGGEKILVYEYISRRSLDLYLSSNDLTWVRRLKICIGVARGLAYLHNPAETQQRVLHRDIKSSNILLDENWNARIADFGLSKFGPANQPYTFLVSTAVGTFGYCDPIYIETGLLTKESDVYSLGVVLFEVLCGRLCIGNNNKDQSFTELVRKSYKQSKLSEIIYGNIKDDMNPSSFTAFTTIAYRCLKRDREQRPSMNDIVTTLETALRYQDLPPTPKPTPSPPKQRSKSSDVTPPLSKSSNVPPQPPPSPPPLPKPLMGHNSRATSIIDRPLCRNLYGMSDGQVSRAGPAQAMGEFGYRPGHHSLMGHDSRATSNFNRSLSRNLYGMSNDINSQESGAMDDLSPGQHSLMGHNSRTTSIFDRPLGRNLYGMSDGINRQDSGVEREGGNLNLRQQ